MWWPPRTEDERTVYREVSRLSELFLSPSRRLPWVYGVGSTIAAGRRRVPLLIVDEQWQTGPADLRGALGVVVGHVLERLGFENPFRQSDRLFVPLIKAHDQLQRALGLWNVPSDTLLVFARPPVALRTPGSRIWSGDEDATVGFVLRVGDRFALSTAGHLVKALPCEVTVRRRRLFGWIADEVEPIGSVGFYNDPRQQPGVDVAVVDLPSDYGVTASVAADLADAASVRLRDPVVLLGGRSGEPRGWVAAPLQELIDEAGRHWTKCWLINDFTDGFGQEGDSGGRVVLEDSKAILGHIVGAMGVVEGSGRRQTGIVQDIHAILAFQKIKYRTVAIENAPLIQGAPRAPPAPPPEPPTPGIGIRMPDVVGRPLGEAQSAIDAAELEIGGIPLKVSSGSPREQRPVKIEFAPAPAGTVIKQSPAPGALVAKDAAITLTVVASGETSSQG